MPMSEAVTMPSLMMMISTVSEESLARDARTHTSMYTCTHTHTHTHTRVVYVKFAKSLMTLQTKKTKLAS